MTVNLLGLHQKFVDVVTNRMPDVLAIDQRLS